MKTRSGDRGAGGGGGGKGGLLPRSESNMSAYDLNLDDGYSNYREKLEDDRRRSIVSSDNESGGGGGGMSHVMISDRVEEGDDDDIFGESGSFIPANVSQHLSQDNPWMKVLDDVSGMYYYFNSITGESTWDKPAEYVERPEYPNVSQTGSSVLQDQPRLTNDARQSNQEESNLDWNDVTLYKIQHEWNPQQDLDEGIRSQATTPKNNSPSKQGQQKNNYDDSDDDQPRMTSQTNIMNNAYGEIYDSQRLIVDEDSEAHNKFLKMKRGGSLLRESMGWQEWLSPQGAIFYLRKGFFL